MRLSRAAVEFAMACATIGAVSASVDAQIWDRLTNSRSTFKVEHPPRVALKGVTKVSVLEFTGVGNCGPELTERLTERIARSSQFEIVDRGSIDAVLREQGFQTSGAVSPDAQVKLGALLGPAAIFTGRVTGCSSSQLGLLYRDVQDRNKAPHRQYIARSAASVTVSIALIDLTTGKRYSGGVISISDTLTNEAQDARPEYPSLEAIRTRVSEAVISEAAGMLFPTYERIEVVLYDDKQCELQRSANQIKASDFDGAAATLKASIANACGNPNDKPLLAKAYYNLGVALTYSDHHGEGLTALQTSAGLRRTGITDEGINAVRRLMTAAAERARAEANAVEIGALSISTSAQPLVATLTNKDIADLVKAKMPDAVILAQIKNSPCKFDISPAGLIALKQAGASDAVLLEVTDAASKKCK